MRFIWVLLLAASSALAQPYGPGAGSQGYMSVQSTSACTCSTGSDCGSGGICTNGVCTSGDGNKVVCTSSATCGSFTCLPPQNVAPSVLAANGFILNCDASGGTCIMAPGPLMTMLGACIGESTDFCNTGVVSPVITWDFSAATSMKMVSSGGYAPTTLAVCGYDTTAKLFTCGNGTTADTFTPTGADATYAKLSGRTGSTNDLTLSTSTAGTIYGSSASGQNMNIKSTSHATKGAIELYDPVDLLVGGIATGTTVNAMHIGQSLACSGGTCAPRGFYNDGSITLSGSGSMASAFFQDAVTIHNTIASGGVIFPYVSYDAKPTVSLEAASEAAFLLLQPFKGESILTAANIAAGTLGSKAEYSDTSTVGTTGASGSLTITALSSYSAGGTASSGTSGGALTVTRRAGFSAGDMTYVSTGNVTVTTNDGFLANDMVQGTSGNRTVTNVNGFESAVASGTNKHAFNDTGGAPWSAVGKFDKYNNDTTAGNGLASVVAFDNSKTTQTASLGATTLLTSIGSTAMYRICCAVVTHTSSGTSTMSCSVLFTQPAASAQTTVTSAAPTATANAASLSSGVANLCITVPVKASTTIQYSTTLTGTISSASYDVTASAERIQ